MRPTTYHQFTTEFSFQHTRLAQHTHRTQPEQLPEV